MSDTVTPELLRQWDSDAERLTDVILAIPASQLDDVIAGEWSARQILSHLLDSEIVFGARLRAAIAQPGSAIAVFDQDAYASLIPYGDVPIDAVGAAFTALRRVNTAIALALPASAWEQTVEHPERGTQSLSAFTHVFGGHIASHLADLQTADSARG